MANWREEMPPEYWEYHKKVVEAAVAIAGEQVREFFDKQCSYDEEFKNNEDPEEVAQTNVEDACR